MTVVDKVVDRYGTREVAEAYLKYLYSEEGQELAAKYHYRPSMPSVAEKYREKYPTVELMRIDTMFGGWHKAQKRHFDDGGTFDKIYQPE